MDGVLTDFIAGAEAAMKKVYNITEPYSEEQYEKDDEYKEKFWSAIEKYETELGHEFWYELKLLPDALDLWDYIKQHNPEILSATGDPKYGAGKQKRKYIKENLGEEVIVNLTRTAEEKCKYAKQLYILIDDKEKAIDPWKKAGGIGILHTSANTTIQELKKLGL